MVLFRFSLREIWLRPLRAGLTLVSIVIGVGAIVAVSIANQTTQNAHREMYETITGKAALEVTKENNASFDESITKSIEGIPGVAAVVPVLETYFPVGPAHADQKERMSQILGIDLQRHDHVQDYEIIAGEKLSSERGVLLPRHLAEQWGVAVGDEVSIQSFRRNGQTEPIVGIFKPRGATAVSNLTLILMAKEQVQSRHQWARKGSVSRILIVLNEQASESSVMAAMTARLEDLSKTDQKSKPADQVSEVHPPGLIVRRPASRTQNADETGLAIRQGTNMALAFALLVAVFVILNTFLMNVGERSKQLAILRAVGATRWQIAWLIGREAVLMGLIGSVGGGLVGVLAARLLVSGMERLHRTTLPAIELTWQPFAIAAAVGLGIALLGALFPVLRTFSITPRQGIQGAVQLDGQAAKKWPTLVALGLFAESVVVFTCCRLGWLPMQVALIGTLSTLVGLVLLLPLILSPVTHAVARLAPRFTKVEATLAQRQLLRNPGRSVLTIGVLFIAVSTGVGLANTIMDNVLTIKNWYRKTVVGDYFLWKGDAPGTGSAPSDPLEESLKTEIWMDGVKDVDKLSVHLTQVKAKENAKAKENVNAQVNAEVFEPKAIIRDFPSDDYVNFETSEADSATLRKRLWDGEVIIGSVLAERAGYQTGDTIRIESKELGTSATARIAAVANEYRFAGMVLFMQRDAADKAFGEQGIHEYIVLADPSQRAQVGEELQALCQKHGLTLNSVTDITEMIDGMMNGVVGGLWGLLVLGFVVAALGLANTLTMNVLEQTRELGMLRAVAMTRRQVRKMILSQAIVMGAVALLPGLLAGVGVAFLINQATPAVTGHPITFAVHPVMLAVAFASAYVIVVAVAWLPAERAARLSPSTCLQYE